MWYFNPTTFVCYLTLKSSVSLNYNSDFLPKKLNQHLFTARSVVTTTDAAEESGESKQFIKNGGQLDKCEN